MRLSTTSGLVTGHPFTAQSLNAQITINADTRNMYNFMFRKEDANCTDGKASGPTVQFVLRKGVETIKLSTVTCLHLHNFLNHFAAHEDTLSQAAILIHTAQLSFTE